MYLPKINPSELKPVIYPREAHPISRNNIDQDALKIMYRLLRHGYKAFMVGGGVRDLLLGKRPKDFDISTDATPRRVKEIFRNSRIIGRRFKLVHVFFRGGKIIEVSTFRDFSDNPEPEEGALEPETSIAKHDNKYGNEVTDALRRDLTINGLFYDLASFSIIDYVGGVKDLSAGIIRTIGDPNERFIEDPVRMLRAVRHAARSDFKLDNECRDAIFKQRALLLQSSSMRVFEELKKDLHSGYALKILRLLADTGILSLLIPELFKNNRCLLDADNALARSLDRIDQQVLSGSEVSTCSVISILLLFACTTGPDAEVAEVDQLYQRLESVGDLLEVVRTSFCNLAVPKREKERVEELLHGLMKVLAGPPEELKLGNLSRRASFHELVSLIQLLNDKDKFSKLLEVLSDPAGSSHLSSDNEEDETFPRTRRRRRRRGRRSGAGRNTQPRQRLEEFHGKE